MFFWSHKKNTFTVRHSVFSQQAAAAALKQNPSGKLQNY